MPRSVLVQSRFCRQIGIPGALKLILALREMGKGRVQELAEKAGIKPARASQIIQGFRSLDVVTSTAEGRLTYYSIAKDWRRDVDAIRKSVEEPAAGTAAEAPQ